MVWFNSIRPRIRSAIYRPVCLSFVCLGILGTPINSALVSSAAAQEIRLTDEGFTEPDQTVQLASADLGVIEEFMVQEGALVKPGDVICKLDTHVLEASLAIAKAKLQCRGRIDAAEATQRYKQNHLRQLESLRSESHASEQEVNEARHNLAQANAALQVALDDQAVAQAEFRQIEAQIERRYVKSSIAGVVVKLPRQAGESLSANENHVATIAKLDRLRVRLYVNNQQVTAFTPGRVKRLKLLEGDTKIDATVGFVSPVTDSTSGTVRVDLLIDNTNGLVRSGVRCVLVDQALQATRTQKMLGPR